MPGLAGGELRYDGAVVLVTGGERGVGSGITRAFLDRGATVVTCGRRAPDDPLGDFLACDIRDAEQVESMVKRVLDRHGRFDVLVNNAGGGPPVPAAEASPRLNDKVVALNLLAPMHLAQQANAAMQRQDSGGSIVMVSSVSGTRPSPNSAAYGAAKAGLDNLTTTLAVEWAPKVRVNALTVGMVRTEASLEWYGGEDGVVRVGRTVPLGRLAEPEDVGNCAVFLASPLASYVSGASLLVHGGGELPAYLAAANDKENNA